MLGAPLLSQAVNKFTSDTPAEMALLTKAAVEAGASGAVVSDHWAKGGAGALELVSHAHAWQLWRFRGSQVVSVTVATDRSMYIRAVN